MMWLPKKNDFNILDDMFNDFNYGENKIMKTDIKETDNSYILKIDLPGYDKDNIKISIDDDYLVINATIDKEENEDGSFVRRERYYGQCSRSFYIGNEIKEEDIKAKFKNGILSLEIPKNIKLENENKKYIDIE